MVIDGVFALAPGGVSSFNVRRRLLPTFVRRTVLAPDDVAFVDAIPMGATGKMLKNKLREQFREHRLPVA